MQRKPTYFWALVTGEVLKVLKVLKDSELSSTSVLSRDKKSQSDQCSVQRVVYAPRARDGPVHGPVAAAAPSRVHGRHTRT